MPTPFPHRHVTSVTRTLPSRVRIQSDAMKPLEAGPSRQFDGDATTWSAEQLLLSSIATCLLTTFEALAARDKIEIHAWKTNASGIVERSAEGLQFTSIVLSVDMAIGGNTKVVEQTLEDARRLSLVLTSLRVPVVFETQITTVDGAELRNSCTTLSVIDDWYPLVEEPILAAC